MCGNRRVNIYTNVYLSNTIHPDSHGYVICIVFTAILVTDRLLDASSSRPIILSFANYSLTGSDEIYLLIEYSSHNFLST